MSEAILPLIVGAIGGYLITKIKPPQPEWAVNILKNIRVERWRPDGFLHPTIAKFLGTGVWQDPTDPTEIADGAFYLGWTGNGFDPDYILEIWRYRDPVRLSFQLFGGSLKVYFAEQELTGDFWLNPTQLYVNPLADWMIPYVFPPVPIRY